MINTNEREEKEEVKMVEVDLDSLPVDPMDALLCESCQ